MGWSKTCPRLLKPYSISWDNLTRFEATFTSTAYYREFSLLTRDLWCIHKLSRIEPADPTWLLGYFINYLRARSETFIKSARSIGSCSDRNVRRNWANFPRSLVSFSTCPLRYGEKCLYTQTQAWSGFFLSHSTQGVLNRNLGDAVAPRASKKLGFFYNF